MNAVVLGSRSNYEHEAMKREPEESLTLEILEAIDTKSNVTQRHLADQLGVALGLANSYLKRCVRKGLVKIQHAPANRYLYYLTPQGFAEKSRLTAEYLTSSLQYYNRAGESMIECFAGCVAAGHRQLVFAGISELAEIASVRAHDFDIRILGTVDPDATVTRFLGRPVWRTLDQAHDFDAVLFTALANHRALFAEIRARVDPARLIVPGIVKPILEEVSLPT